MCSLHEDPPAAPEPDDATRLAAIEDGRGTFTVDGKDALDFLFDLAWRAVRSGARRDLIPVGQANVVPLESMAGATVAPPADIPDDVLRSRELYRQVEPAQEPSAAHPADERAGAYIGLTRDGGAPLTHDQAVHVIENYNLPDCDCEYCIAARARVAAAAPRPLVAPPRPGQRYHVEDERAPGKMAAKVEGQG